MDIVALLRAHMSLWNGRLHNDHRARSDVQWVTRNLHPEVDVGHANEIVQARIVRLNPDFFPTPASRRPTSKGFRIFIDLTKVSDDITNRILGRRIDMGMLNAAGEGHVEMRGTYLRRGLFNMVGVEYPNQDDEKDWASAFRRYLEVAEAGVTYLEENRTLLRQFVNVWDTYMRLSGMLPAMEMDVITGDIGIEAANNHIREVRDGAKGVLGSANEFFKKDPEGDQYMGMWMLIGDRNNIVNQAIVFDTYYNLAGIQNPNWTNDQYILLRDRTTQDLTKGQMGFLEAHENINIPFIRKVHEAMNNGRAPPPIPALDRDERRMIDNHREDVMRDKEIAIKAFDRVHRRIRAKEIKKIDCIGLLKGLEKDLENTQKKIDKYSEISGEHLPDVANPSTDVLNVLKCMEGWRDEVLVQQSKLVRLERQQENVRKERLIRVENLLKKT